MNRTAVLVLSIACALPLLAPGSAATSAALQLDSGIPIKIQGSLAAHAGPSTLIAAGDAGQLAITADARAMELTTVRIVREFQTLASGARALENQRTEEDAQRHPAAQVVLGDRGPDFFFTSRASDVAWASTVPSPPASFAWSGANAQITALLHEKPLAPADVDPSSLLPESILELRSDGVQAETVPESIAWWDGTFDLHLQGQSPLRLAASLTARLAPGAAWMPDLAGSGMGGWTGPGTHVEEVQVYYRLALLEGRAHLAAAGQPVSLFADSLQLELDGFAGFPWARGSLTVGQSERPLGGDQVVVGGVLRVDATRSSVGDAESLRLEGSGDVTFLQIGPHPESFPVETVIAAGGTAALATAGLAAGYYWPLVKWSASGLIAPLYARLPRDRVLDHRTREGLFERVRSEPGISTNRLAHDFPVGWSTLTYHLRVLERNEKIVSVRDGRYKRFFDRESGQYANGRKFVVAVLKNDATLAVGRLVQARPGLTQKDVSEHFELAPSSVHWHVERLAEARLVEKRRDGHFVRYRPGPAWREVRPEDLGSGPPPAPPLPTTPSRRPLVPREAPAVSNPESGP